MKKKRRSAEEIRVEKLIYSTCQDAMNGYSINMLDMHQLSDAGKAAANSGGSDEQIKDAILAARDILATKV